ncbi:MAG: PorP/SprF family type IX secretion system membrane protein [Bacteroidales bacterium]|nr:PorP/SprF family type IX secretion system membrane protein [Bacteroidales bacterium]
MKLRYRTLIGALLLGITSLSGQDSWYGSVSGMQMMYNPGFTGAGGAPSLNISAFSFFPGNGFGLRSFHASYDAYFSSLHGGAGVWVTDDMLGDIMNDLRGGASYAYHFRAGRDVYVTAGLTASVITRGIRTGSVILPDDIDPFRGITGGGTEYISPAPLIRFDLGTGFTVSSGPWYGGVSVMHLTRPSLSDDDLDHNRINRLYTFTGGVALSPREKEISFIPSAAMLVQGDRFTVYLGSEVSWRELSGALSLWHVNGGFTSAGVSAGWEMSSIKITLSYNYILAGGDSSFGGTAIIRAGAGLSFGNVEKRRVIHIIKLPGL